MIEAKGRHKIGIVVDDYAVRESLRFLLEIVGHPTEAFASAADFIKSKNRTLSCLILDHHMPHMTGLELAERLLATGEAVPILLLTDSPHLP